MNYQSFHHEDDNRQNIQKLELGQNLQSCCRQKKQALTTTLAAINRIQHNKFRSNWSTEKPSWRKVIGHVSLNQSLKFQTFDETRNFSENKSQVFLISSNIPFSFSCDSYDCRERIKGDHLRSITELTAKWR